MYYINLELSRLLNTEFVTREVDGVAEEGIWIPIKRNHMIYGKGRTIFLPLAMRDMQPNARGYTHYISLLIRDKKIRQKLFYKDGFINLKFLGNAKPRKTLIQHMKVKDVSLKEAMEKDSEENE